MTSPVDLKEYAAKLVTQFGHRLGNPDWDIIVEMRDEGEELSDAEVDEVYNLWRTAQVTVTWPDEEATDPPKCSDCGGRSTHHCESCGGVCDSCIEHCQQFGHDWEVAS